MLINRLLHWFYVCWTGFMILANILAIAGFFASSGLLGGLAKLWHWYSPFNVTHWLLEFALFSPALIAYLWRQNRLEEKRS
jgi:membrane protein implicated in regulation of membrane protease activity